MRLISSREWCHVSDDRVKGPECFDEAGFDVGIRVLCIEEKPAKQKSSWKVTAQYFYGNKATRITRVIMPAHR